MMVSGFHLSQSNPRRVAPRFRGTFLPIGNLVIAYAPCERSKARTFRPWRLASLRGHHISCDYSNDGRKTKSGRYRETIINTVSGQRVADSRYR